MIPITQVLDGCVRTIDVAKEVRFEPNLSMEGEDPNNQLYIALLVIGEQDEVVDALGLFWSLPSFIHDTPERSKIWAKHCVEIMKSVIVNSRPRNAIKDATFAMETALLMRGELELCSLDALCGRG